MNAESNREESAPTALACAVGALEAEERQAHFALLAKLFTDDARERREVAGGYAFRFEAEAFEQIARFVANERKCCPFLTFTIELAPDNGPLWLHLTGPAGTRAFLEGELPLSRTRGA